VRVRPCADSAQMALTHPADGIQGTKTPRHRLLCGPSSSSFSCLAASCRVLSLAVVEWPLKGSHLSELDSLCVACSFSKRNRGWAAVVSL
jgi:thiamine pyrophosphokinase